MSCQRGNASRSRSQKYKNQTAFKNDLHDTSHRTKAINNIEVANVCERCKKIIEWKIKYKKYKPLKAPAKCTKCEQKTIKHTYHTVCLPCARHHKVCPKCTEKTTVIEPKPTKEESLKLDTELQALLKKLPERKRRTFIRYMNRQTTGKKENVKNEKSVEDDSVSTEVESKEGDENSLCDTREDILTKLKALVIEEGKDKDDDFGSDFDDDSSLGSFD